MVTIKRLDKAFTTEIPTPCKPPEKRYCLFENLAPLCNFVKINSTPVSPSSGCISTGIPRPSSITSSEPSLKSTTSMDEAWPSMASSTLLSMASWAKWLGLVVSVYIPGRRRTGSSPLRTSIDSEVYDLSAAILSFENAMDDDWGNYIGERE